MRVALAARRARSRRCATTSRSWPAGRSWSVRRPSPDDAALLAAGPGAAARTPTRLREAAREIGASTSCTGAPRRGRRPPGVPDLAHLAGRAPGQPRRGHRDRRLVVVAGRWPMPTARSATPCERRRPAARASTTTSATSRRSCAGVASRATRPRSSTASVSCRPAPWSQLDADGARLRMAPSAPLSSGSRRAGRRRATDVPRTTPRTSSSSRGGFIGGLPPLALALAVTDLIRRPGATTILQRPRARPRAARRAARRSATAGDSSPTSWTTASCRSAAPC